jgi:cell wall-associated NlpC family hydrolase
MEYAVCTVPAAPMRKEASHRSEMVNQLLFGETMVLLEQRDEWFRVRSFYDQYEGWLTEHLVTGTNERIASAEPEFITTEMAGPVRFEGGLMQVPAGSSLRGFDAEKRSLWDESYRYEGQYRKASESFDDGLLLKTAGAWMNAPYLWGGKTFMGVDCSGFVQTVFKILGIRLMRDAYQQAEQGRVVETLSAAKRGDLAFFHNEKGRVTHVGMILDGMRIIHASGKVRRDPIGEEGIVNRETGKRTHPLHSIRRYF